MGTSDPPPENDFKARLEQARQRQEQTSWRRGELKLEQSGAAGKAWRLSVEMVSALAVCGGFGWLLDKWLDTKPWWMLVFLLIGGVVGIYNVIKVAKRMNDSESGN